MPGLRECPTCGERSPDQFRFCGYCGTAFDEAPSIAQVRRTVTIVYSDLQGSTELGEKLEYEALREVVALYYEAMRAPLEGHGGSLEKFVGDAVIGVFGLPHAHEDDALRAVRAAAAMADALEQLNETLEPRFGVRLISRTGVNTGEVVTGKPEAGQRVIVGDAVNTAARLEAAAPPMGVLMGEETFRLVRDAVQAEALEPLTLKGKAKPVPAYLLLELEGGAPRRQREQPLAGREEELRLLGDVLAETAATGRCSLVTLVGEPGIGKSRLIAELIRQAEGTTAVRGRCLSYGDGITFWPVREIVYTAAQVQEYDPPDVALAKLGELSGAHGPDVVRRVAAAIGLVDDAFPVEELFWGIRKLLEEVAAEQPLLVVVDDVHWAEETMLELLEHLRTSLDGPVMLLCAARPDLLERRSDWPTGAGTIRLAPLGGDEIARVLDTMLGGELDPGVCELVLEASGGNPLFASQTLSMLVDEDQLRLEGGRLVPAGELSDLSLPRSLDALLTARMDALSGAERELIQAGSVVGQVVPADALLALIDEQLVISLPDALSSLAEKGLIERDDDTVGSVRGFRFVHGLVRDAAYGRLLKRSRAELHERFADWSQRLDQERGREGEFEEIVAYHLEQAHRFLVQLAPLDAHGRRLGRRASRLLEQAGRRAFGRGDMYTAAGLLQRAVRLLPQGSSTRAELIPELGEALAETGRIEDATHVVSEAYASAPPGARGERLRARTKLVEVQLRSHAGDAGEWAREAVAYAEGMIPKLEDLDDDVGLATAYRLLAWAEGTLCHYGPAADAAERAVRHASRARDDRQRRSAASSYAVAALWGPTPAGKAIERCRQIIADASGDRRTEGIVTSVLAHLVSMEGDAELSLRLSDEGRAILQETGRTTIACSTSLESASVALRAGRPELAERDLRRDYQALEELGERYLLPTVAALLAHTLYASGAYAEADRFATLADRMAPEDDVATQALWRSVRACVLARSGSLRDAEQVACKAVDLLAGTDTLIVQAYAELALAEVLHAAGRSADAAEAAARAAELVERKGDVVTAARARAMASSLQDGSCAPA